MNLIDEIHLLSRQAASAGLEASASLFIVADQFDGLFHTSGCSEGHDPGSMKLKDFFNSNLPWHADCMLDALISSDDKFALPQAVNSLRDTICGLREVNDLSILRIDMQDLFAGPLEQSITFLRKVIALDLFKNNYDDILMLEGHSDAQQYGLFPIDTIMGQIDDTSLDSLIRLGVVNFFERTADIMDYFSLEEEQSPEGAYPAGSKFVCWYGPLGFVITGLSMDSPLRKEKPLEDVFTQVVDEAVNIFLMSILYSSHGLGSITERSSPLSLLPPGLSKAIFEVAGDEAWSCFTLPKPLSKFEVKTIAGLAKLHGKSQELEDGLAPLETRTFSNYQWSGLNLIELAWQSFEKLN